MNGVTLSLMALLLTFGFLWGFFENLTNYLAQTGAL